MRHGEKWRASWIWGGAEESPRNEWRCFRRSFVAPKGCDAAVLSIAADSRYALYVNGEWVGRGPARSWPEKQSYDTYEVGHLIRAGERNTIAVLVMHFGVSTFYYVRGRGGLLAQMELLSEGQMLQTIATDGEWRTVRHPGHDPRSPRMSCQQAFSERIDARLGSTEWVSPHYDDADWERALTIGTAGTAPWTELEPRDIPLLAEESRYPSRIESLRRVEPIAWSTAIDVRSQMDRDSANHCNPVGYVGYLATTIRVKSAAVLTLGFPNATSHLPGVALNGAPIEASAYTGKPPERYVELTLRPGDNFLWLDVTHEADHGRNLQLGMDSAEPFELVSPFGEQIGTSASPFVSVGPFDRVEVIDHRPGRELSKNHVGYLRLRNCPSPSELTEFERWIRPVPKTLVSRDNVFVACIWSRRETRLQVPYELRHAIDSSPAPGVVPLFDEADTEMIVDFGLELSGYLAFDLEASAGTIVDFYGFEYMRDDYRQDTYDLDNTLRYICTEGRQAYISPIRRGMRYVMVTVRGASRPLKLYGLQVRQSHYPVAEIGAFRCSDALLNDIWDISRHTTRLCMEDTFVDCPAYEQVFWVGDSRNEALINYYTFGDTALVKRCLRLVPGSRSQTPLYANQVPSGWSSVIPNWTFFWAQACKEFVDHTGDAEFAAEMWPHIRYTLDHYWLKRDERGLLSIDGWNLLDWAPIDQPNRGVVTHQNAFLCRTLQDAAALARIARDPDGAELYEARAERLREAVVRWLWSDDRQAFADCLREDGSLSDTFSVQTQVVAYLCGIAQKEREAAVRRHIVHPPESFVRIGSPFMAFFYYEALARMGDYGELLADMRRNYGQMVELGATACWEMYPNFAVNRANPEMPTRSHCHAWSAAPGYFLGAYVLGIRPSSSGWEEIVVEPQPVDLLWARGSVPHPAGGRIDVSWRIVAECEMQVRVWTPAGVRANVRLPEGFRGTIERAEF